MWELTYQVIQPVHLSNEAIVPCPAQTGWICWPKKHNPVITQQVQWINTYGNQYSIYWRIISQPAVTLKRCLWLQPSTHWSFARFQKCCDRFRDTDSFIMLFLWSHKFRKRPTMCVLTFYDLINLSVELSTTNASFIITHKYTVKLFIIKAHLYLNS